MYRRYREGRWFHRHFMFVHALSFVVAVQWAIASAAAIAHHWRGRFRDDRDA